MTDLPPDLEFFRKLGINVIADPDCPRGNLFFLSSRRRRHPDITVHEGPDVGKIIPGGWAETEEEWARRCGIITNIGISELP